MLAVRIIPCLDVKDGRVVKGVNFVDLVDAGDPVEAAAAYDAAGADELCFLDITASHEKRGILLDVVRRTAERCFMPLTVGGGVRTPEDVRALLTAGADKVSVNTPALQRPGLVDELAAAFGSQCVVVGIDSLRDDDGEWRVRSFTGDPARTRAESRLTLDWVREVQDRGAGEVVLNCMGSDGVRAGYDIAQLQAVRAACGVPLVASGGAGAPAHFLAAFAEADVDAALAASVFHAGTVAIPALKSFLHDHGIEVRLG